MENEELIFVLNTGELKDGGFEGSFNDFASELEDAGAVVSGDYDEEGVPVMTVYGIDTEEINDMLSSYGVGNPEEYTSEVESAEEFDFDEDGADEIEMDDDEEIEIVDDDDDEEIEIVDDDEMSPEMDEGRMRVNRQLDLRRMRESRQLRNRKNNRPVNEKMKSRGTQNLSESVTLDIVNRVKDEAIKKRILECVKRDAEMEAVMESYVCPIPFAGIKVNGKEIIMESLETLGKMLNETKMNYKRYYKGYKSLNESESDKSLKFKKVLKKQHSLIQILENVIAFKSGKLFEDEMQNTETPEPEVAETPEVGDQTATLTAIVFKVKNADDFIKTLTDHGVPEEALKKVGGSETEEGSDEQPQQDAVPQQDAAMGGAAPMGAPDAGAAPMGGGNPFESLTTRLTEKNKLNEDDENPFGSPDQPSEDSGVDPLNTESHDNAEEGEEVRLVDTSYASKVQQILQDVYGLSKEEFENKIGGQIEDEGQTFEDSGSDEFGDTDEEDDEKEGEEEDINPEDVFGDL